VEVEPYSWKIFLIIPLWSAYQERQDWWETTRLLGSRLSTNPASFSAVANHEQALAAKGRQVKAALEILKDQTEELTQAFRSEARTPTHLQEHIQALAQLGKQIDHTLETHLWGTDISPKMVARAAPFLDVYRETWEQLNQALNQSRDVRRDTRSQLEVNQTLMGTIAELLESETEAGRPTETFRRKQNAEIELFAEQEKQRQTGTYLKEPALEQNKRLLALEKDLRLLIQERLKLEARLARGEQEIVRTEGWMASIEAPFTIDQTDKVLQEVTQGQAALYDLLRASEDIELLRGQSFPDPGELANSRAAFDQQIQTYQELHQALETGIPSDIQQVRVNIQNLRPLHIRYHKGLDLDGLSAQAQSLEDDWAASRDIFQIQESQIEAAIADLHQLESARRELQRASKKAAQGLQTRLTDLADARSIIEAPAFLEYHQVMQVIWREHQLSLSEQAGDCARRAEGLNIALEQIDADFAAAVQQAANLLVDMKALWETYKRQYAAEKEKYQSLAEKMDTMRAAFDRYQKHELSVFRSRASEPVRHIDAWCQMVPPLSIQALTDQMEVGNELYQATGAILEDLSEDEQNYRWTREDASSAIDKAKTAIQKAEKAMRKIPWGPQSTARKSQAKGQRHPDLEHCYRYLDSAEQAFKDITNPEIEYRNSVRKAISDMGRVRENADRARDAAEALQQEISEQIADIEGKIDDLEKTLAEGQGHAMRLDDTGFQSQWAQIYRQYRHFEEELEEQTSYREAFSYLESALIESRYQIERMREFGG
jgi:hypothetical protein